MSPKSAMKPKGWSNIKSPAVTPIMARGTHSQIIRVFLMELNKTMHKRIMSPKKTGTDAARLFMARAESSASPPQDR